VFERPAAAPYEPLRTFHPRGARLGPTRQEALRRLFPVLGFAVHDEAAPFPRTADGMLDAAELFGRTAPLILDIGPGMGGATVAAAAADPGRDVLAVEAHLPGVANLLKALAEAGLDNVRVGYGDALDLVRNAIAPGTLAEIRAFFPDPWPKARHHKRRLIQPAHVALLRSRLVVGGVLHTATDWPQYAEQMADVLASDAGLAPVPHADAATARPVTAFERKALAAGRTPRDFVFRRTR